MIEEKEVLEAAKLIKNFRDFKDICGYSKVGSGFCSNKENSCDYGLCLFGYCPYKQMVIDIIESRQLKEE